MRMAPALSNRRDSSTAFPATSSNSWEGMAIPARSARRSDGEAAALIDDPSVSEIEAGNRRVSANELVRLAEIYDVSVAWLIGEAPETLDAQDPRLELAARELSKLKPDDLERLLKLLAAMRSDSTANGGDR
jgi:transcriptional regulator with XRE-family HTH domain